MQNAKLREKAAHVVLKASFGHPKSGRGGSFGDNLNTDSKKSPIEKSRASEQEVL